MKAEMNKPAAAARSHKHATGPQYAAECSNQSYALTPEERRQLIVEAEYLRVRSLVRSLSGEDSWQYLVD
jgi:hypothetical protein